MYSRSAPRRRHPAELKAKVLAACDEPGASVAAVAQAHGLNANLVHKWRRRREARPMASAAGVTPAGVPELPSPSAPVAPGEPSPATGAVVTAPQTATRRAQPGAVPAFVQFQLDMPSNAPSEIRLELRRGAATVVVAWPVQEAAACGRWLREWLR
jgi:transposase